MRAPNGFVHNRTSQVLGPPKRTDFLFYFYYHFLILFFPKLSANIRTEINYYCFRFLILHTFLFHNFTLRPGMFVFFSNIFQRIDDKPIAICN